VHGSGSNWWRHFAVKGKKACRKTSSKVEYNYLKGRGDINQFSFQVSPGKLGLVLKLLENEKTLE